MKYLFNLYVHHTRLLKRLAILHIVRERNLFDNCFWLKNLLMEQINNESLRKCQLICSAVRKKEIKIHKDENKSIRYRMLEPRYMLKEKNFVIVLNKISISFLMQWFPVSKNIYYYGFVPS